MQCGIVALKQAGAIGLRHDLHCIYRRQEEGEGGLDEGGGATGDDDVGAVSDCYRAVTGGSPKATEAF